MTKIQNSSLCVSNAVAGLIFLMHKYVCLCNAIEELLRKNMFFNVAYY